MAAKKTTKKVKKVTEIPEAKVTIEVEQTEGEETPETLPQNVEIEEKTTQTTEYSKKQSVGEDDEETPEESESQVDTTEDNKEEEPAEEQTESEESTEEEGEPFSDNPNADDSFSWKKVIIFAIIAAAVGFVIVGGFLYFRSGYNIDISKNSESKSLDIPTKEPTPTPEPVDKSAYQIEVLNGSGIAGEAAAVQEILEDAGYSVGSIGNADNQDYTNTVIAVSEDVKDGYVDELKETLEKRGPVEVEDLSSAEDGDVVVTVGSDLNDEVTPTP